MIVQQHCRSSERCPYARGVRSVSNRLAWESVYNAATNASIVNIPALPGGQPRKAQITVSASSRSLLGRLSDRISQRTNSTDKGIEHSPDKSKAYGSGP